MDRERLSGLWIPYHTVPLRSEHIIPLNGGIESSLMHAATEANTGVDVIFESERFMVVSAPNPAPHAPHPEGTHVNWFFEKGRSWSLKSWEHLLKERPLLDHIQEQYTGSSSYFFIGYAAEEDYLDNPFVVNRSMQTQPPMHIHRRPKQWEMVVPDGYVRGDESPRDTARFLNIAGERSVDRWQQLMDEFGQRFVFHQQLQTAEGNAINYDRSVFGFRSLEEALVRSLELQTAVRQGWAEHAIAIGKQYHAAAIPVLSAVRQSCVPNMQILFPSEEDKVRGNVTEDFPIWINAFGVSSPWEWVNGRMLRRPPVMAK